MSTKKETADEKDGTPEVFAAATTKPGVAPAALTTPCTIQALRAWLDGHEKANPGMWVNDTVDATANAINIVPVAEPNPLPAPDYTP